MVTLRVVKVNSRILERGLVGSAGIGLNYLNSSLPSLTGTGKGVYDASLTPLTELQILLGIVSGKRS